MGNVGLFFFSLERACLSSFMLFRLRDERERAYVRGRAHPCAHTVAQVGKNPVCGSHRRNF